MMEKKIILWSLILSCILGSFLGNSGTAICNAKKTKIDRQQITRHVNDLTDWMAISFLGDWRYQSGWNSRKLDLATRKKKWIPIEVNKNQAAAVDPNGANE